MKRDDKKKQGKSIIKQLREEGRSSEEFEILVSRLTFEELIWLKLELSAKLFAKNKFYGFPLWHTLPNICKDALINFAVFATSSKRDAARFLGVNEESIYKLVRKFNVKGDE